MKRSKKLEAVIISHSFFFVSKISVNLCISVVKIVICHLFLCVLCAFARGLSFAFLSVFTRFNLRPIIFSLRSLRLPVLGAFCPGSERTLLRVTRNLSSK